MISFLMGELAEISTDSITVCCGGVGYEVGVPTSVFEHLPAVGSEVKIHTYLQVREDGVSLYGFTTKNDLSFFKLLIGVNGIGPKGALGILSAMSPDTLRFAIMSADAKTIAKAPGIGLKTAQKMILELSDKIHLEDTLKVSGESKAVPASTGVSTLASDAVLALVALGYSETEALKAVHSVPPEDASDESSLIKAALRRMI